MWPISKLGPEFRDARQSLSQYYFLCRVWLALIAVFFMQTTRAQNKAMINLPGYEFEQLHFGFSLGVNNFNFIASPRSLHDSVLTVRPVPQAGFTIGIVGEYAVYRYLTIRFLPSFAVAERDLNFGVETRNAPITYTKRIESYFLDFPIDLKLRSARLDNFAAFVVAGGKYTIDLASQTNVNNASLSPDQQVVKLQRIDWAYEMGSGVEFYLPYFKFSIEGKLSLGFRNILIHDNTIFSNALQSLYSKMFLLSFTFEG